MLYAEVAVEAARGQGRETYTYAVPDGVDVVPGHRVTVPFGRRSTYGFVVSLGTEEPGVETKPIEGNHGRQPEAAANALHTESFAAQIFNRVDSLSDD